MHLNWQRALLTLRAALEFFHVPELVSLIKTDRLYDTPGNLLFERLAQICLGP